MFRRTASPPFALARPSLARVRDPSGLHVPRSLFCTQPRSKPSPAAPVPLLRPPAAAEQSSGEPRCRPHEPEPPRPPDLGWTATIRSNLPLRPRPLDLDPTDLICSHRFGLDLFLKRPLVSSYSTRGPQPFKNNYRLGLFFFT